MNQQQQDIITSFHLRMNAFAEENPDKLSHILSATSKEDIVVEDYTPKALTKEIIRIFVTHPEKFDELMQGVKLTVDISTYKISSSALARSFDGFGSCECSSYTYSPNSDCYWECIGEGTQGEDDSSTCQDPAAKNYLGYGDCEYGSGINVANILDGIWNVANQIGLDNIFNAITGGDDDDDTAGGGNSNTPNDVTIVQNKTNWGKIALYSGIVVVVGVGIYLLVRRKK